MTDGGDSPNVPPGWHQEAGSLGTVFCSPSPPRNVPVAHLRGGHRRTGYPCFPFKAPVTVVGIKVGWGHSASVSSAALLDWEAHLVG